MRLVRYGAAGEEKPGLIDANGRIRSLADHVAAIDPPTLSARALDTLRRLDPASLPLVADGVRLGPPVSQVSKLIGIGLDYADHVAETRLPAPSEPLLFLKATTAISGPNDDIVMPLTGEKLDWEHDVAAGRRAHDRNAGRRGLRHEATPLSQAGRQAAPRHHRARRAASDGRRRQIAG